MRIAKPKLLRECNNNVARVAKIDYCSKQTGRPLLSNSNIKEVIPEIDGNAVRI